jgi:hypothetical protein
MTNVLQGRFGTTSKAAEHGDDLALGDVALDVLFKVVEMLDGDADVAVRSMLLAVAEILQEASTFGKAAATSSMLLHAVQEALEAFHNPPPFGEPGKASGEPT